MHRPQPDVMKALLAHEGVWEGTFIELRADGTQARHAARVTATLPRSGPYAFREETVCTFEDGTTTRRILGGVLRQGRLWFDTERYAGWGYSARETVQLDLERKGGEDGMVREVRLLSEGGAHRARTWHWFKDGALYRWTLCDERRA